MVVWQRVSLTRILKDSDSLTFLPDGDYLSKQNLLRVELQRSLLGASSKVIPGQVESASVSPIEKKM
jgi:hypothetical protein